MYRKTICMDLKEKTDSQIQELLDLASKNNLKGSKVGLFRAGVSILHETVFSAENKAKMLNEMLMKYD
jgi:hypothetical protein